MSLEGLHVLHSDKHRFHRRKTLRQDSGRSELETSVNFNIYERPMKHYPK